jgi:hypothetical protein
MRRSNAFIPIGALTLALGLGGSLAEGAQRDGQDRGGRQSEGHARQRSRSGDQQGNQRDQQNNARERDRARDQNGPREQRGNNDRAFRDDGRRNQSNRQFDRLDNHNWNRRDDRRPDTFRGYAAPRPRVQVVRPRFNHYYGPGSSVFFGFASGYRYGSPYRGRVYGYVPAPVYGVPVYYGDVRLQLRPRDAAVFVDGYYAGIVDDFDGIFQRLTLTVGPHEIEIEAPGLQPQVYNMYVDPARTVDVRADLYPVYP